MFLILLAIVLLLFVFLLAPRAPFMKRAHKIGARRKFDPSVYFVADPEACAGRPVVDVAVLAAAGGATMVQLRDKSENSISALQNARALKKILDPLGIPLIINDRVDVALAVDAAGVHLGQGDMPAAEARRILGPEKIIGVTAFEQSHFESIDPSIVDYTGTGPFFATQTKPDKPVLGVDEFARLVKLSPVPVIGIGGITPANAHQVIQAGAAGVAMMRSISESPDPRGAAAALKQAVGK